MLSFLMLLVHPAAEAAGAGQQTWDDFWMQLKVDSSSRIKKERQLSLRVRTPSEVIESLHNPSGTPTNHYMVGGMKVSSLEESEAFPRALYLVSRKFNRSLSQNALLKIQEKLYKEKFAVLPMYDRGASNPIFGEFEADYDEAAGLERDAFIAIVSSDESHNILKFVAFTLKTPDALTNLIKLSKIPMSAWQEILELYSNSLALFARSWKKSSLAPESIGLSFIINAMALTNLLEAQRLLESKPEFMGFLKLFLKKVPLVIIFQIWVDFKF